MQECLSRQNELKKHILYLFQKINKTEEIIEYDGSKIYFEEYIFSSLFRTNGVIYTKRYNNTKLDIEIYITLKY